MGIGLCAAILAPATSGADTTVLPASAQVMPAADTTTEVGATEPASLLVDENFDDQPVGSTPAGWTVRGGGAVTVEESPDGDGNSLRVVNNEDSWVWARLAFEPNADNLIVTYRVYLEQRNDSQSSRLAAASSSSSSFPMVQLDAYQFGRWRVRDGASHSNLEEYQAGRWYDVEWRIWQRQGTYDLLIDGEPARVGGAFFTEPPAEGIGAVDLYGFADTTGVAHYDDFAVRTWEPPAMEPSALFGADDIQGLRDKTLDGPAAQWRASTVNQADAAIAAARVIPDTCESALRNALPALAFAYVLTGDVAYAEEARRYLVGLPDARPHVVPAEAGCGSNDWTEETYRRGQWMIRTAVAYDWIKDSGLLTDEDVLVIQADLLGNGRMVYDSMRKPDWHEGDHDKNSHINRINFRMRSIAGLGVVAEVLTADGVTGEPQTWADFAWDDLFGDNGWDYDRYLERMVSQDGVYNEGQSYYAGSFSLLIPYFYVAERLAGRDAWSKPIIRNLFQAPYKLSQPDRRRPTLNAGWHDHDRLGAWVAPKYPDDPAIMWHWVESGRLVSTGDYWFTTIFYDAALEAAAAPPEETSFFFTEAQYALLRSDWERDGLWFLLNSKRLPATSAHDQADQTSFALTAKGAMLAIDPGDGRDCRDEPGVPAGLGLSTWQQWIQRAYAHNLVLVDGKGPRFGRTSYTEYPDPAELQMIADTPGLVYASTRMAYNYEIGDGTAITRRTFMPHGDYVVVVDSMRSPSERRYDWQLHFAGLKTDPQAGLDAMVLADDSVSWSTPNADGETVTLEAHVTASAATTWDELEGRNNFTRNDAAGPGCVPHPYVHVTTEGDDVDYLAVLLPFTENETPPTVEHLADGSGAAQATTITSDSHHDLVIARTPAAPRSARLDIDGVRTNAEHAFVSRSSTGEVESFLLENGRELAVDGQRLLFAARPLSAVVSYTDDGLQAHIAGVDRRASVRIYTGDVRPERVLIDGVPSAFSWNQANGYLTVHVDPGSADITVEGQH
jgi:hypothetical protein